MFVAENKLIELYQEVLNVLDEFSKVNAFPIDFYEIYGCMSIIHYEKNNKEIASQFAIKTLEYSKKK